MDNEEEDGWIKIKLTTDVTDQYMKERFWELSHAL